MPEKMHHLSLFEKIKMNVLRDQDCGELPVALNNSMKHYKNYKDHLTAATENMYRLMNGHPKCRPDGNFEEPAYAPAGLGQVDHLAKAIKMLKHHAWEMELIDLETEFAEKVRVAESKFQHWVHEHLGHIRNFLGVQYPKFVLLKNDIVRTDQQIKQLQERISGRHKEIVELAGQLAQMDQQATEDESKKKSKEATTAKPDNKERSKLKNRRNKEKEKLKKDQAKLEAAVQVYKEKVAEVTTMLVQETEHLKEGHLTDLHDFMKSYMKYHRRMEEAHGEARLAAFRPTMYEQPLPTKKEATSSFESKKKKKFTK